MTSKMKINQFKWLAATLMLVAAMVMPSTAWAWEVDTHGPVGNGTSSSPYLISDEEDLYWFANYVNGSIDRSLHPSACAELMDNIEVNGTWTPIMGYSGTFDGKGHTISGLQNTISDGDIGLFGTTAEGSVICNVGIVNCRFSVKGGGSVGGVCGRNYGTIKNCYNTGTVDGYEGQVGGICGLNYGTIKNCYNTGSVNEGSINGGVCGINAGTITNCYYLSGTATDGIFDNSGTVSAEVKTAEQFANGEVAWLLNGKKSEDTEENPLAWYQNIDGYTYPVLDSSHGTVYQCTPCTGVYSNAKDTQKDHTYPTEFDVNGFKQCSHCEATQYQPATLNTNNQYEIGNAGQLYWFANKVNTENATYGSANAVLTADITVNKNVLKADGSIADDVSGFRSWTPIENYKGTFDGKGHTVSGLYFNDTSEERVGLFGCVDRGGKISNVGVLDSYFQFKKFGGGVCGWNFGEINNCYSFSTVISTNNYIGGVCGYNYGGKILNSYNNGIVSGNTNTGGVCGNNDDNGEITNCHNSGTISGTGDGNTIAGVCGYNVSKCTISGCYNTGAVSGQNSGGVCFDNYGTIKNCYNTGSVSGQTVWGGVCGSNTAGTVMSCYNIGVVNDIPGEVGGICGSIGSTSSTINCYFDSKICSGVAIDDNQGGTVDNVEGKSLTQFASGEVCYLLNGSSPYGEWGQQFGENDYPVLGSAYKVIRAAQDGQDGTNYWATFSNLNSNAELTTPTGNVTVYNATVSGGKLTLTERGDKKVAKSEGVLLKAGCEYLNAKNISETVSAATREVNHLVATPATAQTVTADDNYTLYRLTYNKVSDYAGLGFYLGVVGESKDGSKLNATPGKAYLNVLTSEAKLQSSAAPARGFAFPGDDGETTGIECITVTDEGLHRNGNADDIFDLQGRKVSKPTKGVYIKNNKKVVIN